VWHGNSKLSFQHMVKETTAYLQQYADCQCVEPEETAGKPIKPSKSLNQGCTTFSLLPTELRLLKWITACSEFKIFSFFALFLFFFKPTCVRGGMQAHPKTFDLVKIRAKFVNIWAKCVDTFAKSLCVFWFHKNDTQNQSADFFLEVMFLFRSFWAS